MLYIGQVNSYMYIVFGLDIMFIVLVIIIIIIIIRGFVDRLFHSHMHEMYTKSIVNEVKATR